LFGARRIPASKEQGEEMRATWWGGEERVYVSTLGDYLQPILSVAFLPGQLL
jgi:hypothetical protein